jgi:hypothetical protein
MGMVFPWWAPFLARRSNWSGEFVDDHRRLAQRLQGCYIAAAIASVAVAVAVPMLQVVYWVVSIGFVATEIRLGVLAGRGHVFRLTGFLTFSRER